MKTTTPNIFEHFAKSGFTIVAFDDSKDAANAQSALLADTHATDDVPIFTATEVVEEITERQNNQSLGEMLGYGFDSESLEQLRGFALQGCTFITASTATEAEEKRLLETIAQFNARIVRKYGTFMITDLKSKVDQPTGHDE